MTNNIASGIAKECDVFSKSIGADKDLILVNYSEFDLDLTKLLTNRETSDANNNKGGLTTIKLKDGAIQHIFEGTDYSVIPSVTPEIREDGVVWYLHSLSFTVYSKLAKDRETLISLGKSRVIAITKDRSTGLYELFGMYQGLRVTGIDRSYVGAQNSNFYTVTIATPDLNVVREPNLSELAVTLDGDAPPAPPLPGTYGDATPSLQGLVRVDTLRPNPIVYTVESADYKFEEKNNKVTTATQVESNKTSTVKYGSLKAIVDWIVLKFEPILSTGLSGQYLSGNKTWQNLDKSAVGLSEVDNTSDADKPTSTMTLLALDEKADLVGGKVPAEQLPSYVDEILEFADFASLPIEGDISKIYITLDTNRTYRWSGSIYVELSSQEIIEVTYGELLALVGSSGLIPSQTYLLTDYETTYTQPVTGLTKSSGIIEPLYLIATDINALHKECKSKLYPQDIVYYEITGMLSPSVDLEGFTKGKIYRRIDTLRNNDIGTDWRHIKYDRSGVDKLLFEDYNSCYDNVISGNNLMNTVIGNNCFSNTIGTYLRNNTIGTYFRQNTISDNFEGNVIGNYFTDNNLRSLFRNNTIDEAFILNDISQQFESNIVGIGFALNKVGQYFNNNTIGTNFKYNNVHDSFNNKDLTTYLELYNKEYQHFLYKLSNGTTQFKWQDDFGDTIIEDIT